MTVNFHVTTPFLAIVLSGYLVALDRGRTGLLLAVIVGFVAGVTTASGPLAVVGALVPFTFTAWFLSIDDRRAIRLPAAVMLLVAAASGTATHLVNVSCRIQAHQSRRRYRPAT